METFLIADDHPLFREALVAALQPLFENATFIEAGNFFSTLEAIEQNNTISMVLLDLNMPGSENFYGLIRLAKEFPDLAIVVVSASETPDVIAGALGFGAQGFIPKSTATNVIAKAIHSVLMGNRWFPKDVEINLNQVGSELQSIAEKIADLTPKQYEVLKFLQMGHLNKQIAFELQVTEATVKAHISAILKKFEVNTRTQAVLMAKKLQLN